MIADLKIKDDDTALAFGQTFDVRQVLEAMIVFIRNLAEEVVSADSGTRPIIRFSGDKDRLAPLDEDAFARLRRETLSIASLWEVAADGVRVDIGPFIFRLYPLGRDDLRRYGAGEPMTVDGSDWVDLDPTPIIDILPAAAIPIFTPRALKVVKGLVRRHAPPGTNPDFERLAALRFPHHAFGAGYGSLRISLLTIPAAP